MSIARAYRVENYNFAERSKRLTIENKLTTNFESVKFSPHAKVLVLLLAGSLSVQVIKLQARINDMTYTRNILKKLIECGYVKKVQEDRFLYSLTEAGKVQANCIKGHLRAIFRFIDQYT